MEEEGEATKRDGMIISVSGVCGLDIYMCDGNL